MPTTVKRVRTPQQLKKAWRDIAMGLQKPFLSTRRMFVQLGVQIDRDTMLTFRHLGAYKGRKKWMDYGKGKGVQVYQNKDGTWQRRPGTDNAVTRRYNPTSQLLQASGMFRQSFKIMKIGQKSMHYGTNHKLAKDIMSDPTRNALHVTKRDIADYSNVIKRWYIKGMKF